VDGTWHVFLPPSATEREIDRYLRQDTDRTGVQDNQTADRTADRTDETPVDALIAAKDETIARLDAEVSFLRDQLDHSRRELADERQRFDVIHREALGRIEALTAGEAARSSDTPAPDSARPGAPGEATGAPETIGTHRESVVLSLWRRLFGRG
jgi:hypothetical protein